MIRSRATFLLLTASVLVLACRGADSTSPTALHPAAGAAASATPWASGSNNAQGWWTKESSSPVRCAPHAPIVGHGTFGPAGGTLVIGESRLVIPGGALLERVTITGTALGDSSSTISFQPEGLRFRKPAGLVISSAGCNIPSDASPSVVYLGPTGEVLETISAYYDPRWRRVAAPIQHFSGYAIAF